MSAALVAWAMSRRSTSVKDSKPTPLWIVEEALITVTGTSEKQMFFKGFFKKIEKCVLLERSLPRSKKLVEDWVLNG
jgi:hypothetical protein